MPVLSTIQAAILLTAATTVAAGSRVAGVSGQKTFQASGSTSSGTGAATILVQGSHDGTNWDTIGTISLTLATTTSSDSFASNDRYAYVRGNVTAISGTGAAVSLTAGY
ncbi:MAG: hypothetical protein ACRECD_01170 [Burkholderiaceae bacterium]